VLEHLVPAERLTKSYFRRWFYWRGISRAMLYQRAGLDMESPEESSVDPANVHHIAGVPRYMYPRAVGYAARWLLNSVRGNTVAAFEHETWLWFFAGVVRQRWKDSRVRSNGDGKLSENALHAKASRDRVA
jgi:hypothetical protein